MCEQGGHEVTRLTLRRSEVQIGPSRGHSVLGRLGDDREQRGCWGITDPDRSHGDHPDLPHAALVQGLHSVDVLRPCRFYDPDRSLNLTVREIGYELAQVAMVARTELVLDDDVAEVGFRHQVDAEGAGADLTLGIAQAEPEHLVEFADVLLEPRREVGMLGRPDLADRHGLDESNFQGHE